jgi:hypothetical protein
VCKKRFSSCLRDSDFFLKLNLSIVSKIIRQFYGHVRIDLENLFLFVLLASVSMPVTVKEGEGFD